MSTVLLGILLALLALACLLAFCLPAPTVVGERLAREAGGYAALESFLDDYPDLACPYCDASGYHEPGCELVARAFEEYTGRRLGA